MSESSKTFRSCCLCLPFTILSYMFQVEFSYIRSSSTGVLLSLMKVGDESALRTGIGTLADLGMQADKEECSLDDNDE